MCRVRCCESSSSSYDPSSTLGTVGTLLNMICVVVGVVIFSIVKVCLFPPNNHGISSFAVEAYCVTTTRWVQTVEVSV